MPVLSGPTPVTGYLQQPATFKPFMRQFVRLPLIARGASSNNIGDVIISSFRNRNDMLSVPYKILFSVSAAAIIAPIMLTFQLFLKLFRSERHATNLFSNAPLVINRFSNCSSILTLFICFNSLFSMRRMIVLKAILSSLFRMLMVILLSKYSMFFRMIMIVLCVVCSSLFFVFLFPLCILNSSLFSVCLVIGFVLFTCTCSTYVSKFAFVFAKGGNGKSLLTLGTLLCGGILGYSIKHGRTSNSIVMPSDGCNVAGAKTCILYLQLYHKSAWEASSRLPFCPTYNTLEV